MARRRRRDGDELRKGLRVGEEEVACSGFCRAGLLINFGASPIGRFSFCTGGQRLQGANLLKCPPPHPTARDNGLKSIPRRSDFPHRESLEAKNSSRLKCHASVPKKHLGCYFVLLEERRESSQEHATPNSDCSKTPPALPPPLLRFVLGLRLGRSHLFRILFLAVMNFSTADPARRISGF